MKVYTKRGDDGTTGLLYGSRVPKNDPAVHAYGAVDEAQAAMGLARAGVQRGHESGESNELDELLIGIERDLWVLMADLALNPQRRDRGTPGKTLVTAEMVAALESTIDDISGRFDPPTDFAVPGGHPVAAALDFARTVMRRAERESLDVAADGSHAIAYLNRCSDLLWTLARWAEGESLLAKDA